MNKRALIADVAKNTIYTNREVEDVFVSIFDRMIEALENGEEVNIPNFGKFALKYNKPKEAKHPKTGKKVNIPEKVSIVFNPTRLFRPTEETISTMANRSNNK